MTRRGAVLLADVGGTNTRIGLAGPEGGGYAQLTNGEWRIDPDGLRAATGAYHILIAISYRAKSGRTSELSLEME